MDSSPALGPDVKSREPRPPEFPRPRAPEPRKKCNAPPPVSVSSNREDRGPIPIDLETVTETRLVAEALAGSQSAFERIVRRYQRPVISLIARLLGERGDRAMAEDLAQETFVKAYLKLAAFDTTRRLSSWLFRIAHNTAIDALRRPRLAVVPTDDPMAELEVRTERMAGASPPDPVETQALGRALDAALAQLRPEYRVAITLRYEEGLPFEEIAQVLGIPEVTARSYVHRARKQLAVRLTADGWGPSRA
jgi:RNA polymerase sigma-70 factor (ECF subfamily)